MVSLVTAAEPSVGVASEVAAVRRFPSGLSLPAAPLDLTEAVTGFGSAFFSASPDGSVFTVSAPDSLLVKDLEAGRVDDA